MKKFLLGVLAGIILAGMTLIVLVFAAVQLGSRQPSLPDNFALSVRLEGDIPELRTTSAPLPSMAEQEPLTVAEMYSLFERARRDQRVKGLFLRPAGLRAGWAKVEELRRGIESVRAAGKPVYVWLRSPGLREYYLSTAADRVYLSPEDVLDVKGMRIQMTYLKGTFDKLGLKMEIEHAGKYKDAGDVFTRTGMSPETRETMNSILDEIYPRVVAGIATGRKLEPGRVKSLLDQGPFLPPAAKHEGLVDELNYEAVARKALTEKAGVGSDSFVRDSRYMGVGWSPDTKGKRRRVALLVAQGDIVRGSGGSPFAADQLVEPGRMASLAKEIGSSGVDAVVVRIDSPGGDAVASDEILSSIKEMAKKKPTVISMSDLAASGGYYIAMTGDPVVAEASTLTGSIGVIYGKLNIKGLYDKLGMSTETLTRGRFAAIDSSVEPLSSEGRAKLREGVDFVYSGFLGKVAAGRKKKVEEVAPHAQGRVWLGSQAQTRGLVDQLGGLKKAIELAGAKAGFGKDDMVEITVYPRRKSFFEVLFDVPGAQEAEFEPFSAWLRTHAPPGMAAWMHGGMLRVLPYSIELK